jgi:uncharacterized phage-associated protein
MRGFNYKKTVQALNLLAQKSGGRMNKMKAIKLIWLSDRLHLRRHGRTITGDVYFALPHGPVPSATRDVLQWNGYSDDIASGYASSYIDQDGQYFYKSTDTPNLKVFSKTDLDCINVIYDCFGSLDEFQLRNFSHIFPEWVKHSLGLTSGQSSRYLMDESDFFINVQEKSGLFQDSEEFLSLSKEMFVEGRNISSLLS